MFANLARRFVTEQADSLVGLPREATKPDGLYIVIILVVIPALYAVSLGLCAQRLTHSY